MNPIVKPKNIKIHFILGSGRAGTTLLRFIFNNHKNCISTPETKHLLLFYKKYKDITEVTSELLDDIKTFFSLEIKFNLIHNYQDTDLKFTLGEKITYFELCKKIYIISVDNNIPKELTTIIDKNPSYTLHIDTLAQLLPDANFLCPVRDYRSFVLSSIQNTKRFPIQYHAIIWRFHHKLILKAKEKYPQRVLVSHYEYMVKNKEDTLKNICDFFNLDYDLSMFNIQDEIDILREKIKPLNKYRYDKLKVLAKPINSDRSNAWENSFTNFQLKVIEFWCSKTGDKFGYEKKLKSNFIESSLILFISLPYYMMVFSLFKLKSIWLVNYLVEKRKIKLFNSLKK